MQDNLLCFTLYRGPYGIVINGSYSSITYGAYISSTDSTVGWLYFYHSERSKIRLYLVRTATDRWGYGWDTINIEDIPTS